MKSGSKEWSGRLPRQWSRRWRVKVYHVEWRGETWTLSLVVFKGDLGWCCLRCDGMETGVGQILYISEAME